MKQLHFRMPLLILSGLLLLTAYTNCSKHKFTSDIEDGSTAPTGPLLVDEGDHELQPAAANCASKTVKSKKYSIDFADPGIVCDWNQNGNLGIKDAYIQARREQKYPLDIPMNAEVCDLKFAFKPSTFRYDDHFFITFNKLLIAGSNTDIIKQFSQKDGLYVYDWNKIVGMTGPNIVGSSDVYCPGVSHGVSTCSWPETQATGTIKIAIQPEIIQKMTDLRLKTAAYEFEFITTGDNDASDCQHNPVSFDLEVKYVE